MSRENLNLGGKLFSGTSVGNKRHRHETTENQDRTKLRRDAAVGSGIADARQNFRHSGIQNHNNNANRSSSNNPKKYESGTRTQRELQAREHRRQASNDNRVKNKNDSSKKRSRESWSSTMIRHQDLSWLDDEDGEGDEGDKGDVLRQEDRPSVGKANNESISDTKKSGGIGLASQGASKRQRMESDTRKERIPGQHERPHKDKSDPSIIRLSSTDTSHALDLASSRTKDRTDKNPASIAATSSSSSLDILRWRRVKPGPNDPRTKESDGITYFWCELCNRQRGEWNTHTTAAHKAGNFGFVSRGPKRGNSATTASRSSASSIRGPTSSTAGCEIIDLLSDSSDDDNEPSTYSSPITKGQPSQSTSVAVKRRASSETSASLHNQSPHGTRNSEGPLQRPSSRSEMISVTKRADTETRMSASRNQASSSETEISRNPTNRPLPQPATVTVKRRESSETNMSASRNQTSSFGKTSADDPIDLCDSSDDDSADETTSHVQNTQPQQQQEQQQPKKEVAPLSPSVSEKSSSSDPNANLNETVKDSDIDGAYTLIHKEKECPNKNSGMKGSRNGSGLGNEQANESLQRSQTMNSSYSRRTSTSENNDDSDGNNTHQSRVIITIDSDSDSDINEDTSKDAQEKDNVGGSGETVKKHSARVELEINTETNSSAQDPEIVTESENAGSEKQYSRADTSDKMTTEDERSSIGGIDASNGVNSSVDDIALPQEIGNDDGGQIEIPDSNKNQGTDDDGNDMLSNILGQMEISDSNNDQGADHENNVLPNVLGRVHGSAKNSAEKASYLNILGKVHESNKNSLEKILNSNIQKDASDPIHRPLTNPRRISELRVTATIKDAIDVIRRHGRKTVNMNSKEGDLKLSEKQLANMHNFIKHSLRQFRMDRIQEGDNSKVGKVGAGCLRCVHCNYMLYRKSIENIVCSSTTTGGVFKHILKCKMIGYDANMAMQCLASDWNNEDEESKKVLGEIWKQVVAFGNRPKNTHENDMNRNNNNPTRAENISNLSNHQVTDIFDKPLSSLARVCSGLEKGMSRNATAALSNRTEIVSTGLVREHQQWQAKTVGNELLNSENAIEHLSQAEKEIALSSDSLPIMNDEKHLCTNFMYYLFRQYRLDIVSAEEAGSRKPEGGGCLRCRHCSFSCYRSSPDPKMVVILRDHVLTACNTFSDTSRKALKILKDGHQDERKDAGLLDQKVFNLVLDRMVRFPTDQEETVSSSHDGENPDVKLLRLPVMTKINEEKVFSGCGLPSLKFTVENEVTGHLYDFIVTVGDSLIPNAGYGAFLRLCRVRKLSKTKARTVSRLPLVMTDENGRNFEVYLTPHRIHDDVDCDDQRNYVEDDSIRFSSLDKGCGQIDLGSYGPFLGSDKKWEKVYDLKNFLFDFEPSRWCYGFERKMEKEREMMLDITDDATGETHTKAMENIPMYVNEVGHDPNLKRSVIPCEDDDNICIRYSLCLEEPISVGETIEILVNYGAAYEETRTRHGYGKSSGSSDQVETERIRLNQSERVHMENIIFNFDVEQLHDVLVSLKRIVDAVFRETKASEKFGFVPEIMTRQWTARFRIHWLETLLRSRYQMIKNTPDSSNFHAKIKKLLGTMKRAMTPDLIEIIEHSDVVREIFKKEILEENFFTCSKVGRVIHPLDPSMWCLISRNLTLAIAEDLSFEYKMGNITLDDTVNKIYSLAKEAGEKIRNLCNNEPGADNNVRRPEALVLRHTSNEIISQQINGRLFCASSNEVPYVDVDLNNGNLIRKTRTSPDLSKPGNNQKRKTTKIDVKWYILWQVLRVAHFMAKSTFHLDEGKNYSFEKLCESVAIDVTEGRQLLAIKMDEPYDQFYTSQYEDNILKSKESPIKSVRKSGTKRTIKAPKFTAKGRIKRGLPLYEDYDGSLPEGWRVEYVVRKGGASAGHVDKYWFTPDNTRIRSRSEVKRYLDILAEKGEVSTFKSK